MTTPVIIDCDPGHDDAIALLLAVASPEVEVLGVTTVGGNSGLANTTRNALSVLEIAGRADIPVAAGCDHPLVRPLRTAAHVHGESGLDGPVLEPPTTTPIDAHAVDFIAQALVSTATPVTIVAIGPLTNIGLLLRRHPGVVETIDRLVLMGGSIGLGNITPAAEFNIWADPEAADIVFRSGLDLTMVGLDVTHQARMGPAHGDRIRPAGRSGAFVADLLDYFVRFYAATYGYEGAAVHDVVAVAEVIWPDLIDAEPFHVVVDTTTGPSQGRTVVDRWGVTGSDPNSRVGLSVDGADLAERLIERISTLP